MRPVFLRRWHFWRYSTQAAFLVLFLGAIAFSFLGIAPEVGNWFLRLDASAGLSAILAGRILSPTFLPALGLLSWQTPPGIRSSTDCS